MLPAIDSCQPCDPIYWASSMGSWRRLMMDGGGAGIRERIRASVLHNCMIWGKQHTLKEAIQILDRQPD